MKQNMERAREQKKKMEEEEKKKKQEGDEESSEETKKEGEEGEGEKSTEEKKEEEVKDTQEVAAPAGETDGVEKRSQGPTRTMEEATKPKEPLMNNLKKLTFSINEAWGDDEEEEEEDEEGEEKKTAHEEIKDDKASEEGGTNGSDAKEKDIEKTDGGEDTVSVDEKKAKADDDAASEEKKEEGETKEDDAIKDEDILPPLFAREDPDTLLDRLNTRRLYLRIFHYKRKQREKLTAASGKTIKEMFDYESIKEMFDLDVREKMTANRVYRKNVTIQEMADLEWDELLEIAEIRNSGEVVPFEPIPTQHELLLFSPCPRAVAILASYPRSGNSLMRTMYEHTTLRVTGSDMQGGLAKHDLVGEMAVGANMVQFVKTHFPERQGGAPFQASRVVLLVRNPFDAMESFFNLMMTGTHTKTITPEVREKTKKQFEEYVLKEIRVWKRFHNFWMSQDIPLLLIRYEDLIREPDKVMARVLQFVLEIQRMGTFFSERIDRCIKEQQEIERMGSYKPRSGGIGKSLAKYSPELLKTLKADENLKVIMAHLGYKDLLSKPVEEWSNLEPLRGHATEFLPTWHMTEHKKVVIVNKGGLARTRDEVTMWGKIKAEMGIIDEDCNCANCQALRAKQAAEKAEKEEGKEGEGQEAKIDGDEVPKEENAGDK